MKAYAYQRLDREYEMHKQAWINQQVKATNKKGESKYKNMKDFFDYEKYLSELDGNKKRLNDKQSKMAQLAARVNA